MAPLTHHANNSHTPTAEKNNDFAVFLGTVLPSINSYLESHAPRCGTDAQDQKTDLNAFLYDPLARFTRAGGKRTRPALVLLGAACVCGTWDQPSFSPATGADSNFLLAAATAIEDFQTAALIHDDIADKSELRRGEPCLHLTQGVGPAINAGDLALVHVLEKVLDPSYGSAPDSLRMTVARELCAIQRRTLEGQALDLGWARDARWDISVSDYLSMATHKTAYYSAAYPLRVGALIAGGTPAQLDALFAFGMDTGLAFQLQDDLLNLCGSASAQGKDNRSDITEGKRTMAVAYALEHLTPEARTQLVALLGAHTTDKNQLQQAVDLMEDAGALDAVRAHAQKLVVSAKEKLQRAPILPQGRALLESMADFFVERAG